MCVPAGLPGYESCAISKDGQPEDFGPGSSALIFLPELIVQLRSNDIGMGVCFVPYSLTVAERP